MLTLVLLAGTGLVRPTLGADDCACRPCDFDQDGDVDQADFGHLQVCLSGTGVIASNPACQDAKLAGHAYIDQQDIAIFRSCLRGEHQPYPDTDLPDVMISEFMAANDGGLADEDGDHPDWIEIYVPCLPSLDLAGWFLTDDPDNLKKWAFPSITLGRGDYLLVFASGKDRRDPAGTLHTNFQLDKDGEYLAVVRPDGLTVEHAYQPFPEQLSNVSYGMSQGSITVVAKGAQAAYHVPTSSDAGLGTAWTDPTFPDATWDVGATGLGFSSVPSVFSVTVYKANVPVSNLDAALQVLMEPPTQDWSSSGQAPTINFWNSGDAGHFAPDLAFPGMGLVSDVDDFVTVATGSVVIPTAGEWTFGVNSDDGFSLGLAQGSHGYGSSFPDLRTASDTLSVFDIAVPGVYTVNLTHFDRSGGSSLELFAAQGYYEAFDANAFRLVGDVAGGGLSLGGLGVDVLTNLGYVMPGMNGSVWMRIPFDLADPTAYKGMKLRVRYVDGFVAFLNGQEIARRNAPSSLAWNSAATAKRTGDQAGVTEQIDVSVFHGLLRAGRNVLAIQGLNDAAADGDFAIVPELILSSNTMQPQYFAVPTPGQPNGTGAIDFVRCVTLSQEHGFRTSAFQLAMSSSPPDAEMRYTLDGSTPTASTGLVYSGPITISGTSVVRAAGFKPDWLASPTVTSTYLFVNDILHQSPQGQAPGPAWPAPGYLVGQRIDYGMDPDIVVNDARYSSLVDDALLALPSVSLVTELDNLFGAANGIYTHAAQDGRAWERPCSLEWINPDGSPGFQINAGVRIRGGYSRTGGNPKHAFRLFFRGDYGEKELKYPIFGNEGVDTFDKVDLRTDQNYSWSFGGDAHNTMVRDLFVRDTQGAMGEPFTHSRSCHLYIDGQYWGIYHFQERAEANFAASYFGGSSDDYDVVKVEAGPYTIYATDGDTDAWYRLWQACQAGFSSDAAYYQVQGLNVDGSRNPNYEVLADVDNTIDCALLTYWCGDLDGPISAFLGNGAPNNFYVIRNRDGQSGFKCFKHDCEHTLFSIYEDRTGPWPAGQGFAQFNPQYLSQCLAQNAEYRVRFGDRVQKHMFNGGVLTPASAAARFMGRANIIQTAIIAESARWGDAQRHPPLNRDDHWWPEINNVVNGYFPARSAILIAQLQADGLYPTVGAPVFSSYGGQVSSGYGLTLSLPSGTTGTIYYTSDGSDPRLRGGSVAPGAQSFGPAQALIPAGATWRYLDTGVEQAGWNLPGFSDTSWAEGAAQLGYSPDEHDEATVVSYGPDANNKYPTTWFRKSFSAPAGSACTALTMSLLCDDGAAVYLNGNAPVKTNTMPASWNASTYCGCVGQEGVFVDYAITPSYLNVGGQNVLAVEVHQCGPTSSDLSFDLSLTGTFASSPAIVIDHNMVVKARILSGNQWSALVEAAFVTGPSPLVINEFMADNATTIEDPDEPGEYPDWIEIYNPAPVAVEMGGMYLTDDFGNPTKFRIDDGVSVPANGYRVFWADEDGSQGSLHANFKLSKSGEQIGLYAADGVTQVDAITFGTQTTDVSYGRYPDCGATWGLMATPTPGAANGPLQ